jgi:hypothetical protein
MKLSDEQLRGIVELVESTPWGDVEMSIETLDTALRIALEITREEFAVWNMELEPAGYEDEFDDALLRDLPMDVRAPFSGSDRAVTPRRTLV